METEGAKETYKERAATAEWVNARARAYGLPRGVGWHGTARQLTVRGVEKVLSVLLLVAITHDLLRWIALRG